MTGEHKGTPHGIGKAKGSGQTLGSQLLGANKRRGRKAPIKHGPEGGMTFGSVPDYGRNAPPDTATSIFDPVLCELHYRWFCRPKGRILDPFAGGSVRGIVASRLQRHYTGIDLSVRQLTANIEQGNKLCDPDFPLTYLAGDSSKVLDGLEAEPFDYLFSCPPYADLERYSEDPADLSTMAYNDFRRVYRDIIEKACRHLRKDSFATFVVGDVRDKDGCYYGFPWHTVEAFQDAGLKLYNEAVLVTMAGSLPIRARAGFMSARKLGKTHQNCLTFVKGDPIAATKAIGDVDFGEGAEDPMADERRAEHGQAGEESGDEGDTEAEASAGGGE